MSISLDSSAEEVTEWLVNEGFNASLFYKWKGNALFGATVDILKEILGVDEGRRLFSMLNSLRG